MILLFGPRSILRCASCLLLYAIIGLYSPAAVHADEDGTVSEEKRLSNWTKGHFEMGESIARLKFQVNVIKSCRIKVGAHVSLLPPLKVPLNQLADFEYDNLHEGLSFGLDFRLRIWRDHGLEVCPIKGVLIIGNDWGAVFPGWHVAPQFSAGKFLLGTQFNLFRSSNSELYAYWVPVTVSYRF